METVEIFVVVWASYSEPCSPSFAVFFDQAEAEKTRLRWIEDLDIEDDTTDSDLAPDDHVYIEVINVPIPQHLRHLIRIDT